jgi:hypothetical protein
MVRYLTMNGESATYTRFQAFALRYRRVNATFCEIVKADEEGNLETGPSALHPESMPEVMEGSL